MEEEKKYESVAARRAQMQGDSKDADALNPEIKGRMELSAKERREIEKEKLKDMSLGKKAEYIWMYYKHVFFWTIGVIAAICIVFNLYENSKMQTVLSINVVNAGNYEYDAMTEEVREILGATGKYDYVSIGSNFITNAEGDAFDYNSQMAYVTQLSAQDLDVMILPETLYEEMKTSEVLYNLKDLLGEELYASFGEDIDEYHISLTNNETLKKFGAFYEPACVVVFSNTTNAENIVTWIKTLTD